MLGAGFVLTFSLAGLFIGRLVDRVNRRNLLVAALAIWSISAAAGGLAHDGVQLFLTRMGVGVGEAALFPIAVSLIADYYEPARARQAVRPLHHGRLRRRRAVPDPGRSRPALGDADLRPSRHPRPPG